MSVDYIPASDNDMVNVLVNLGIRLAPMVATFGLTAADAMAVTTDAASLRTLVLDREDKLNIAKAATATKTASRTGIDKRTRALVKRLKVNANYTPALGQTLGIVATAGTTAMLPVTAKASVDDKPVLKASVLGNGTVMLKFAKNGHTGVLIYCRQGTVTEFTLLAKQFRSPCIDGRATVAADAPEAREYMVQFFDDDAALGQMSDRVTAIVPGNRGTQASAKSTMVQLAKAA